MFQNNHKFYSYEICHICTSGFSVRVDYFVAVTSLLTYLFQFLSLRGQFQNVKKYISL